MPEYLDLHFLPLWPSFGECAEEGHSDGCYTDHTFESRCILAATLLSLQFIRLSRGGSWVGPKSRYSSGITAPPNINMDV